MSLWSFLAWLPALLGIASADAGERGEAARVSRVVIQDELIVRIPLRPAPPRAIEWVERKGPKCIPVSAIRGATLAKSEHVDFVLFDRSRVRARLDEDCPALDFYEGFYVTPEDGAQLCAKKDLVHSRMGGSCRIQRFRRLQPRVKR